MPMTTAQDAVDTFLVDSLMFSRSYQPTQATIEKLIAMQTSGKTISVPPDLDHRKVIIETLQSLGFSEMLDS